MDARSTYREAAVRGASPVQLVIALYEQILHDLRRALSAFEKQDIEMRTRALNHALMVIGQLQSSLNMERGGEVAQNLQRFYNMVRRGLVEAQCRQSPASVLEQISHVTLVHDAWIEMERNVSAGPQDDMRRSPALTSSPGVAALLAEWDA
jgi:flagellar secretion chaperone FliS